MRVIQRVDQLHIHAHLISRFLYAAFENVRYAELLRDLRQIFRRTFEILRRRARDHFEIGDLGQSREDFILHAFAKVGVVRIAA